MGALDEGSLQRYEDGHRLVVGCIPYKVEENELKILMVRSQSGKNLVFPKGGWESHESAEEGAAREAQEEAGVQGSVSKESLGKWIFYKSKRRLSKNPKGACRIEIFPLEVTHELKNWPEQHRQREWIKATKIFGWEHHTAWIRESLERFIDTFQRPLTGVQLAQPLTATTPTTADAAAAAAATTTVPAATTTVAAATTTVAAAVAAELLANVAVPAVARFDSISFLQLDRRGVAVP